MIVAARDVEQQRRRRRLQQQQQAGSSNMQIRVGRRRTHAVLFTSCSRLRARHHNNKYRRSSQPAAADPPTDRPPDRPTDQPPSRLDSTAASKSSAARVWSLDVARRRGCWPVDHRRRCRCGRRRRRGRRGRLPSDFTARARVLSSCLPFSVVHRRRGRRHCCCCHDAAAGERRCLSLSSSLSCYRASRWSSCVERRHRWARFVVGSSVRLLRVCDGSDSSGS